MNQGIYDLMFGSYLKHLPTKEDKSGTGWMAKFESMGDYGEKFKLIEKRKLHKKLKQQRRRPKQQKKAAEEEAAAAEEKEEEQLDEEASNSDD